MDYIFIRDLRIFAHHGVLDEEKKLGQQFSLSLKLYLNLQEVACSDDINSGICYKQLTTQIANFSREHRFYTLEALAGHLGQYLLKQFTKLLQIEITIEKPGAAIGEIFDGLGVCLNLKRDQIAMRIE